MLMWQRSSTQSVDGVRQSTWDVCHFMDCLIGEMIESLLKGKLRRVCTYTTKRELSSWMIPLPRPRSSPPSIVCCGYGEEIGFDEASSSPQHLPPLPVFARTPTSSPGHPVRLDLLPASIAARAARAAHSAVISDSSRPRRAASASFRAGRAPRSPSPPLPPRCRAWAPGPEPPGYQRYHGIRGIRGITKVSDQKRGV